MTQDSRESAVQKFSNEVRQRNLAPDTEVDVTPWLGRSADNPMVFQFGWRHQRFCGSITATPKGCRVALTTFLQPAPNEPLGAARGSLLAVIGIDKGVSQSRIKILAGKQVVLDDTIDMPPTPFAIDNLVSGLTLVVLAAAPYLDLLSAGFDHMPIKEDLPLRAAG